MRGEGGRRGLERRAEEKKRDKRRRDDTRPDQSQCYRIGRSDVQINQMPQMATLSYLL